MTVRQLIQRLKSVNQDMRVMVRKGCALEDVWFDIVNVEPFLSKRPGSEAPQGRHLFKENGDAAKPTVVMLPVGDPPIL